MKLYIMANRFAAIAAARSAEILRNSWSLTCPLA